jgi:hypothetical protein
MTLPTCNPTTNVGADYYFAVDAAQLLQITTASGNSAKVRLCTFLTAVTPTFTSSITGATISFQCIGKSVKDNIDEWVVTDMQPSGAWSIGSGSLLGATTALSTAMIPMNSCTSPQTFTIEGTTTSSAVTWSFATNPIGVAGYGTGALTVFTFPTLNTANIVVCNITGSGVMPGAMSLNVRVLQ